MEGPGLYGLYGLKKERSENVQKSSLYKSLCSTWNQIQFNTHTSVNSNKNTANKLNISGGDRQFVAVYLCFFEVSVSVSLPGVL